jgi:hypothetical protein
MIVLTVLGGSGGLIGLAAVLVVIGRGIFRQVNATEDNTAAVERLSGQMETIARTLNDHDTRLAVLEDRMKRNDNPGH